LQAGGHWFEPSRAHSNKQKASKKLEAFVYYQKRSH
ncbi:unnamed protein product, partial [Scytosiphon promiscuus]